MKNAPSGKRAKRRAAAARIQRECGIKPDARQIAAVFNYLASKLPDEVDE